MFFSDETVKARESGSLYRGNERIIRNRRETCTPWNAHKEKGAKKERKKEKKKRKERFPRDWDISCIERRRKGRKKGGTHLWLCWGGLVPSPRRRKRPPGPRSSSCWSQVLTAALVPVYLKRDDTSPVIKSLNLTSIYSKILDSSTPRGKGI